MSDFYPEVTILDMKLDAWVYDLTEEYPTNVYICGAGAGGSNDEFLLKLYDFFKNTDIPRDFFENGESGAGLTIRFDVSDIVDSICTGMDSYSELKYEEKKGILSLRDKFHAASRDLDAYVLDYYKNNNNKNEPKSRLIQENREAKGSD